MNTERKKHTIDFALRYTWQQVTKMYNERAAQYDSTMVFGFTLLSIDPKTGTPATALGPKIGIEPTSLSRTLKTLETKGLIIRKPNPEDGRSVLIILTREGHAMREVSREAVLTFNEQIQVRVGAEKLEAFFEVTEAIAALINTKQIFKPAVIHEETN